LRFVKQAQALGFSLDEIRRILSLRGRGKETCRCVITMAQATLVETEQKLEELQKFRDALKANLVRWQLSSGQAGQSLPSSAVSSNQSKKARAEFD
jgi:DNA-binding transcriptional MerR regulator